MYFFSFRDTGVRVDDGLWHHICVTWKSVTGSWAIYKDGQKISGGYKFKIGHKIPTNGVLIVGQEQDSLGGKFDANQNYIGELTDLNIWRHLHPMHIEDQAKSCHKGKGDVLKWSDFKGKVKGDVKYVTPSNCKVNKELS